MVNELWIADEYAEILELKNREENNENGLRVYCRQYPESFMVQIRTFKPITDKHRAHRGKPRNMMANIELTRKQLHEICDFVDSYKHD